MALSGCTGCSQSDAAATSASAAPSGPPAWLGIPKPADEVVKVLNPKNEAPYSGKTGTLRGKITIKGDAPPATDFAFPTDNSCPEAAATYGKAFRVGQDNALADALVTVTEFEGFVPPSGPSETVKVSGCAFEKRTIALTFGQHLEVLNVDTNKNTYTPYLDGSEYRAIMMAVADGDPIKLHPLKPAINYVLRDFQARPFLTAQVMVLKFSTHDVTGLNGTYEIANIPVGKARVTAFLPAIVKHVDKEIEIAEGDNTADLELTFDASKDKVAVKSPDAWQRGSDTQKEPEDGRFGAPPKRIDPNLPR